MGQNDRMSGIEWNTCEGVALKKGLALFCWLIFVSFQSLFLCSAGSLSRVSIQRIRVLFCTGIHKIQERNKINWILFLHENKRLFSWIAILSSFWRLHWVFSWFSDNSLFSPFHSIYSESDHFVDTIMETEAARENKKELKVWTLHFHVLYWFVENEASAET